MKRVRLISAILCLCHLWSTVTLALQTTGTIEGTVVNGTVGGGPVEGLEVRLSVFQEQRLSETLATATDAEGRFEFPNLQIGSQWVYRAEVPYQGVNYRSGLLTFEPGPSRLGVELVVYEPTTSDDKITVSRAHILITVSGSGLADTGCSVTELYVLSNSGDRTYIGKKEVQGRRPTSLFMLPRSSRNLTLDDGALGGRFLSIEGGFADTEPNWPGTTRVMYSYAVEGSDGGCDLSREVLQPIADLNVLVTDAGLQVESARLTFESRREAQGQGYLNYVAQNLTPGERLDLKVQPAQAVLPSSTTAGTTSGPGIVPGILGAFLSAWAVLALAYPFWRQRVREAAIQEHAEPQPDVSSGDAYQPPQSDRP